MPTCAACAGSRVPAPAPPAAPAPRRAAIQRRPPRLPVGRCKPAASLRHAAGFPGLGLLRRLRPIPPPSADTAPWPHAGQHRDGSHVHCRSIDGTGAQLSPCGHVVTLTQPHATHRRQREVLAIDGQVPTKSLGTRAPLRRPTSIGLESGGVLEGVRSLVHFRYAAPSCLPRPSDPMVLARPGVVGAAPALTRSSGLRLPPASPGCCDSPAARSLTPPDPTAPRGARPRAPSSPPRRP